MTISPADWERMSWHAREKYLRKHRLRPVPSGDPVPVPVQVPSYLNEGIVRRCQECGAWMIDVCNTDHGDRYEP